MTSFSENNQIWIIGGANIDLNGIPEKPLIYQDSNIGHISFSYGGVARNIAEAASLMGGRVNFVSCFSTDAIGEKLMEDCRSLGMNLDYSITTDRYPTSVYIALMDHEGELNLGMSDMRILSLITTQHLNKVLPLIKPQDLVVIDSNLSPELIELIVDNAPCRISADPVSINKIGRLKEFLDRLSILKVNKIEAEALTGIKIIDDNSAIESIKSFRDKGVQEIIITMSGNGLFIGYDDDIVKYEYRKLNVPNPTGAGDAFFGGYLSAKTSGSSIQDAIELSISIAAMKLTLGINEFREINRNDVESHIKDMDIRRIKC